MKIASVLTLAIVSTLARAEPALDYPIQPADFRSVALSDAFWAPRLQANRVATIPGNLKHLEAVGSIEAFAILAGKSTRKHRGYMWGDSDVYKTIEGIVYSLQNTPDPALEKRMEEIVSLIAAAQAPDGYLFPHLQITEPKYTRFADETTRTCESYSIGHLLESASAHYRATGKDHYLAVARKAADLLARVQAGGRLEQISGHPEIELGLVKLYRATGHRPYLDLAAAYVRNARTQFSPAWSSGKPFLGHDEARGHAVAAVYLYCGATDVAALTGEADLAGLVERKWQSMVGRKMYVTGGIGLPAGEAFGADYDLPNARAYAETCAAIASVLWNHRLFLASGEGKYLDVLERALYNGVLAGLSLSGDRFFYPNPLQADGRRRFNHGSAERGGWFGCPCCPVNLVRVIPQVPSLLYATRGTDVYVNLYAAGKATLPVGAGRSVVITQETLYPWEGGVKLTIDPGPEPVQLALRLRIPGWARGTPVPGDLYRYLDPQAEPIVLKVNGADLPPAMDKGFALLRRAWRRGDRVELRLPMPVRRVLAHQAVKEDAGLTALERGPIVYCIEGADHGGKVLHLALPDESKLACEHRKDLLGGLTVIRGPGLATRREGQAAPISAEPAELTAIPYYAWNHRGIGPMTVWLPRTPERAQPIAPPTLAGRARATASFCFPSDSTDALNDGIEPVNSHRLDIPRLTWWDHKGTKEWVQYEWPEPVEVSSIELYWFDDRATGGCRVPASWRLLHREGSDWKPVPLAPGAAFGCDLDRYNRAAFTPVKTAALRIEVQLQEKWSGGILEWKVK